MLATLFNKNIGETCLICGEEKTEGIHILNHLICDSCEKKIIETDTSDEKYNEYIKKLAQLTMPVNKV